MPLLVPHQGEVIALEGLTGQELDLRLYKNDHTPRAEDTERNYVQADFKGYSAKALDAKAWKIKPGDPTAAEYPRETFTSSAAEKQDVYGYYIVRRATGKLVWAERFAAAPFDIMNNGDEIKVTPRIHCRSEA